MSNVFHWDELEIMRNGVVRYFGNGKPDKKRVKEFCDWLEFVLCLVYAYGWHDAEEIVGIGPFKDGSDDKAVNLVIDGQTFRERITEDSTPEEVMRIIDTEAHRDYNTGVYDAAKESGKSGIKKQWETMMDGRVRETHDYLQGMKVDLDDRFYTFDGDSALYPGGFALPENNINCRCWTVLSI